MYELVGLQLPVSVGELLSQGVSHPFSWVPPARWAPPVDAFNSVMKVLRAEPCVVALEAGDFGEGAPPEVRAMAYEVSSLEAELHRAQSIRDLCTARKRVDAARRRLHLGIDAWAKDAAVDLLTDDVVASVLGAIDVHFFAGSLVSALSGIGVELKVEILREIPDNMESAATFIVTDDPGEDPDAESPRSPSFPGRGHPVDDLGVENTWPFGVILVQAFLLAFWGDDRQDSAAGGATYVDGVRCSCFLEVLVHLIAHEIVHVLVHAIARSVPALGERHRLAFDNGGHTALFRALVGNIFGHPWGEDAGGEMGGCGWLPASPCAAPLGLVDPFASPTKGRATIARVGGLSSGRNCT